MLKRRSILIIISDFLDEAYEDALVQLNRKHELILIRLFHPNEVFDMGSGTIPVVDIETNRQRWLNAGDVGYRRQLNQSFDNIETHLADLCKRNRIDFISVNTREDYIPVLESYFRRRNHKRKRKSKHNG